MRRCATALKRESRAFYSSIAAATAAFVQCGACGDVPSVPTARITSYLPSHAGAAACVTTASTGAAATRLSAVRRVAAAREDWYTAGRATAQRALPTARMARMEWIRRAASGRTPISSTGWGRGEVDILLGTQMIAKGLDFAKRDAGRRDGRRCRHQPAGLPGRASDASSCSARSRAARGGGQKAGEVVIQTRVPAHHAVRCAVTHDYVGFVKESSTGAITRLSAIRAARQRRVQRHRGGGNRAPGDASRLAAQSSWRREHVASDRDRAGACPVERVKNRWRWHVLIKAERRQALSRVGRYWWSDSRSQAYGLRMALDRDPVALL